MRPSAVDGCAEHRVPAIARSLVTELLRTGETARFRVRGSSMHPTLKEGEFVRVEAVNRTGIRVGDIIVFPRGAHLCVHRVYGLDRDAAGRITGVRTTGDALLSPDGTSSVGDVLGVVVEVEGARGRWLPRTWLRRTHGCLRAFIALHPGLRSSLGKARRFLLVSGRRLRLARPAPAVEHLTTIEGGV